MLWSDVDMMVAGGPDKRTGSRVTDKTQGVQRGWKWQQKTYRRRRALEDNKNDGNESDKGNM